MDEVTLPTLGVALLLGVDMIDALRLPLIRRAHLDKLMQNHIFDGLDGPIDDRSQTLKRSEITAKW